MTRDDLETILMAFYIERSIVRTDEESSKIYDKYLDLIMEGRDENCNRNRL